MINFSLNLGGFRASLIILMINLLFITFRVKSIIFIVDLQGCLAFDHYQNSINIQENPNKHFFEKRKSIVKIHSKFNRTSLLKDSLLFPIPSLLINFAHY